MTEMRDREEAILLLPHLVDCARKFRTITYKKLSDKTGVHFRGRIPHALRYIRDEICFNRHLPCLTALVVNSSTGVPGPGFLPRDEGNVCLKERRELARGVQAEVFKYKKWQTLMDDFGLREV